MIEKNEKMNINITARIRKNIKQDLVNYSHETGLNQSEIIRAAVEEYMDNHEHDYDKFSISIDDLRKLEVK